MEGVAVQSRCGTAAADLVIGFAHGHVHTTPSEQTGSRWTRYAGADNNDPVQCFKASPRSDCRVSRAATGEDGATNRGPLVDTSRIRSRTET